MNKALMGLVAVVVLALGYVTVKSILDPVQFDKQQELREAVLQKQLKKIATYQEEYNKVHGKFATAEELTEFLNNGKVYYVRSEGEITESMREQGLTVEQAVAKGLIKRDTVWVSAKDSLIKDGTDIATLFDVLSTGNKIEVEVGNLEQEVGKDTINVSVFEARIPFESYLADLDKGRLVQKKEDLKRKKKSYPGLRIGSLEEVRLTGNWE